VNATVVVRVGDSRDRPFVIDLGRRVAATSASPLRDAPLPLVQAAFENLAGYVWTRDHDLLIAEEAGRPVGFVLTIYDMPDEVSFAEQAFIAYMAVEPDAQRHGVGRALLAEVERRAEQRGLPAVSLMVTEENQAARELYRGAGFTTERRMLTKPL
jgi:ribosomal protein S18 acetylase RimI-like enzyme